jgi:Protein of unknown function (DUF3142)
MVIAKQVASIFIIFLACYLFCAVQNKEDRLSVCPHLMLWAWERPENLAWIEPKKIGVAYLERTILLRGDCVSVRERKQPLRVPTGTYLMAVVRLESNSRQPASFSQAQINDVVQDILAAGNHRNVTAVQIDFDARESERGAYRQILNQVRASLPECVPLSMTALASWCANDNWLQSLPVDEAVPMFFRMGVLSGERQQYLQCLSAPKAAGHQIWCAPGKSANSKCSKSIGLATDELVDVAAVRNRRIYLFSTQPWTFNQVSKLKEISRINDIRQTNDISLTEQIDLIKQQFPI